MSEYPILETTNAVWPNDGAPCVVVLGGTVVSAPTENELLLVRNGEVMKTEIHGAFVEVAHLVPSALATADDFDAAWAKLGEHVKSIMATYASMVKEGAAAMEQAAAGES